MNPYLMWQEQTPRQVYELYNTYKDLHKDVGKPIISEDKTYLNDKTYKTIGKPKISKWLEDRIPKGATVYNADVVTQEQMGL